jgi:sirohydrochlorin ferrochelatase
MTRSANAAVLLIAHGSRLPEANEDLRRLAERLTQSGRFAHVEACFLELADPDIMAGGSRCVESGTNLVLMVPYFLSAGVHLMRDLTGARDELAQKYPDVEFRLGSSLGPHPLLDQIVLARIQEIDTPSHFHE